MVKIWQWYQVSLPVYQTVQRKGASTLNHESKEGANGQNLLGFGFGRNQFVCYARTFKGELTCRRVCEVRLFGQHKFEIKQQKYKISQELKEGQAKVLFGRSLSGFTLTPNLFHSRHAPMIRSNPCDTKLTARLHCGLRRRFLDRNRIRYPRFKRAHSSRFHIQVRPSAMASCSSFHFKPVLICQFPSRTNCY